MCRCRFLFVALLLLVGTSILRADAFDYYINPLLAKVPDTAGVAKEVKRLPAETIVESGGVIPNNTSALLVVQREAEYKANQPQRPGLFVYQFEAMSRNRLGYDAGLKAMAADPLYDRDWSAFIDDLRASNAAAAAPDDSRFFIAGFWARRSNLSFTRSMTKADSWAYTVPSAPTARAISSVL